MNSKGWLGKTSLLLLRWRGTLLEWFQYGFSPECLGNHIWQRWNPRDSCVDKWVQSYLRGLITKSIISDKYWWIVIYCDPRHFQKRMVCCYFCWLHQSLQQSRKRIHMLRQLPGLFFFSYLGIYFLCTRSFAYGRELTLLFCCVWCWTTHQSKQWLLCTDWNDQTQNGYKNLTDLIKCLLLKQCQ